MRFRSSLACAAVLLLFVGSASVALAQDVPPGGWFTDDDGNVHEAFIEASRDADITRGCNPPTNDMYCPSDDVTRGQMAAFLVRALNLSESDPNLDFLDDDGSVFESDIEILATAGVTRGCNPPIGDRFCPDDPVTRGQLAAFLVRALGYDPPGGDAPFTDIGGSVFEADIAALWGAGITKGCNPPDNDRYCPDDPVRRDAMASFLARAMNLAPIYPPLDVVGVWDGETTVPFGWLEIGPVHFEFREDWTYSAHASGDLPALYWGDDLDSPFKTYHFQGPQPGTGTIAVVFSDTNTVQTGRVEAITIDGDELTFELWNDWGASPPYGPVVYTLTRTSP